MEPTFAAMPPEAALPPLPGPEEPPISAQVRRGLATWLIVLLAGGVATTAAGLAEGAALFAVAGLFVLAQASDALAPRESYRRWIAETLPRESGMGRLLRWMLRAVLPGFSALYLVALTATPGASRFTIVWCGAGALLAFVLVSRRASDAIARAVFRTPAPSRTLRLTARIAVLLVLLCVPLQLQFEQLMELLAAEQRSLITVEGLIAQLVGLAAIALAGVGAGVRRDARGTCERLGLRPLSPADLVVIALGVAACLLLNGGLEQIERRYLPGWYAADQAVVQQMAGSLSLAAVVLLGLSAGVGEELFVRGALQPRLGLLLSNVLFGIAHVQYSWFGITTVALIGVELGLVRHWRSTSAAILVHMLYNIVAALGSQAG